MEGEGKERGRREGGGGEGGGERGGGGGGGGGGYGRGRRNKGSADNSHLGSYDTVKIHVSISTPVLIQFKRRTVERKCFPATLPPP